MTQAQRGASEHQARVRRAEVLAKAQPAAAEILNFYRRIASFQEGFFAKLRERRPAPQSISLENRTDLDITELLSDFRDFLSLVEAHAPAPLAQSAAQLKESGPRSWSAQLNAFWRTNAPEHGKPREMDSLAQFFPRAFLLPYAEFAASVLALPPLAGASFLCPLCGSRPLLGVLRPEGDGAKRFLLCSFCGREWEFRRILCAACGEEDEKKLPVYVAEQFPHVRVEACDTCKTFLRTIDLTKDGNAIPIVDDIAALPLTLWANQRGYSRLSPNLLGT